MYFAPLQFLMLIDIDVIFLFSNILNAPKQEDEILIIDHGMTSSSLSQCIFTQGASLLYIFVHFFYFILNSHISFKVFTPLVPPKINSPWLNQTIEKLPLPSGSLSLFSPLYTIYQVLSSMLKAKMLVRYSALSEIYPPYTYILFYTTKAQWESTLGASTPFVVTPFHRLVTKSNMYTTLLERLVVIYPPQRISLSLYTTPVCPFNFISLSPQVLFIFFQMYSSQSSFKSISWKSPRIPLSTSYPPWIKREWPKIIATWLDRLAMFFPSILISAHRLSKEFSNCVFMTRLELFLSRRPDLLLQIYLLFINEYNNQNKR